MGVEQVPGRGVEPLLRPSGLCRELRLGPHTANAVLAVVTERAQGLSVRLVGVQGVGHNALVVESNEVVEPGPRVLLRLVPADVLGLVRQGQRNLVHGGSFRRVLHGLRESSRRG